MFFVVFCYQTHALRTLSCRDARGVLTDTSCVHVSSQRWTDFSNLGAKVRDAALKQSSTRFCKVDDLRFTCAGAIGDDASCLSACGTHCLLKSVFVFWVMDFPYFALDVQPMLALSSTRLSFVAFCGSTAQPHDDDYAWWWWCETTAAVPCKRQPNCRGARQFLSKYCDFRSPEKI